MLTKKVIGKKSDARDSKESSRFASWLKKNKQTKKPRKNCIKFQYTSIHSSQIVIEVPNMNDLATNTKVAWAAMVYGWPEWPT